MSTDRRRRTGSSVSSASPSLRPPLVPHRRSSNTGSFLSGATDTDIFGSQMNSAQTIVHVHNHESTIPISSSTSSSGSSASYSLEYGRNTSVYAPQTPPSSLDSEDCETDEDRYMRILMSKGHGCPLWFPQPPSDSPVEYRQRGIAIGDVGVVTDGTFDCFFNITLPADHPINQVHGVPDGFQPLQAGSNPRVTEWPAGYHVASSSVIRHPFPVSQQVSEQHSEYHFECRSQNEGALLALPYGALRENVRDLEAFRDYAYDHALSWFQFLRGRRYTIPDGSIYLVTGCDRTTCWGNATFPKISQQGSFEMEFTSHSSRDPHGSGDDLQCRWLNSGFAVSNTGKSTNVDSNGQRAFNQCTFIRGYTVSLRPARWATLLGPVELAKIPGGSKKANGKGPQKDSFASFLPGPSWLSGMLGFGSGSRPADTSDLGEDHKNVLISSVPNRPPRPINPSGYINAILFQGKHSCDIAITHDDLWCSAVEQSQTPLSPYSAECFRVLISTHVIRRDRNVVYLADVVQNPSVSVRGNTIRSPSASDSDASNPFLRSLTKPRSKQEIEAKKISDQIDLNLAAEARKRPVYTRVLVLGDEGSGKSTLIKQCQRIFDPRAFNKEREIWRLVIQLSTLRELRAALSHDRLSVDASGLSHLVSSALTLPQAEEITTSQASVIESDRQTIYSELFSQPSARSSWTSLASTAPDPTTDAIQILQRVGDLLAEELVVAQEQNPGSLFETMALRDANSPNSDTSDGSRRVYLEKTLANLQEEIIPRFKTFVDTTYGPTSDESGLITATMNLLQPGYMPTDGEILKCSIPSRRMFEYYLHGQAVEGAPRWQFISARTGSGMGWTHLIGDMDMIVFIIPASTFDEKLPEDHTAYRLENAINAWRDVVQTAAATGFVLIINKIDLLERKLKAGIRFSKSVISYGTRPNDLTSVCLYLKKKLIDVHKKSGSRSQLYTHFESLSEPMSTIGNELLSAVRNSITRNNLKASNLM